MSSKLPVNRRQVLELIFKPSTPDQGLTVSAAQWPEKAVLGCRGSCTCFPDETILQSVTGLSRRIKEKRDKSFSLAFQGFSGSS